MSLLKENQSQSLPLNSSFSGDLVPRIHLHQDKVGYCLEVELPGVPKSGVEVSVEGGHLTILGRRECDNACTLYSERLQGNFKRILALDPQIDPSTISAQMEQGLLRIRLRKAEAFAPRKVAVE